MLNRFTKLPPMAAERSAPTCAMFRPMAATLSRSKLIAACGFNPEDNAFSRGLIEMREE